jgi:hypothetical protein
VIRCDVRGCRTTNHPVDRCQAREWVSQVPYGDVHSTSGGHVLGGNRAMRGCCVEDSGNATHQRDSSANRSALSLEWT